MKFLILPLVLLFGLMLTLLDFLEGKLISKGELINRL